jgi:hypothetical protein
VADARLRPGQPALTFVTILSVAKRGVGFASAVDPPVPAPASGPPG